jgi:hypothetical protein
MGFLKGFPKYLVGDVSTGTGVSGIVATLTLTICEMFQLPKYMLMLIEIPFVFAFYRSYSWLIEKKET